MNIHFLGTGVATDANRSNTSVLIGIDGRHHLLDCGFTSAQAYISRSESERLDTIWISHFHGDHFFGIPQLILHFYFLERELPLTLLSGSADIFDKVGAAVELAYPGLTSKLQFKINYHQVDQNSATVCNGLIWQCAPSVHSQDAFGLRISNDSRAVYYSGDGRPTQGCIDLMQNCDLIIHEAYSQSPGHPSHFSVDECLELMKTTTIEKLAMVHLNQHARQTVEFKKHLLSDHDSTQVLIPDDGDSLQF